MQAQTTPRPSSRAEAKRWAAVVARDRRADGDFVYAVRTTGIFCRPSCAARLPKPGNVSFFDTTALAESAGFRPCKRCRPTGQSIAVRQTERIARACRTIERSAAPPSLADLARQASLSPYHFHRLFKSTTGLTPKQYADANRSRRMQASLARGDSVTEAIFGAGFNANSRFYEQADGMLGMTPTRFRAQGADEQIRYAVGDSSLGVVLVAVSKRGICAILLGDDAAALADQLRQRFARASLIAADGELGKLIARVIDVVEEPIQAVALPLDVRGTAFQRRVWQALRTIPVGTTTSYAKIARRIGSPKATRAVAQACGANVLAVAIPCHRVVRADGGTSGYRWGIERKRALLRREGVDTP
ncbi:MAG TPA: bifunctional DNA-binding transcriptional regulator/O6-methylguanine-DNA methyltransferase Ada [Steroidobacteraceae bacterium]|jgi:AraC family transcriptional regulator of adaptative response/methylated-DNA-[protein]-cysteine methyltransferase|nr:bifunctional DNA-binding transcriptional regulator/O6-methylguanine-DNA methyltransferase Ada [Steroidobacteraceae bacterium]